MYDTATHSLLSTILYLVSFHSFAVGMMLIARPRPLMALTDLSEVNEPFFPVQGGMFHIIMAVGYSLAAFDLERFEALIIFSIVVKFLATCFLLTYYYLGQSKRIVLVSGIFDGCMGLVILSVYLAL